MIKKLIILLLALSIFGMAQNTPDSSLAAQPFIRNDILVAEQLALDSQHVYDSYFQELIDNERSQEGIALNVVGTVIGASVTGLGVLFLVGLSNDGTAALLLSSPLLISGIWITSANIFSISQRHIHSERRISYEKALDVYKQKRIGTNAELQPIPSTAFDSLVAEQLALDPSHDYDAFFFNRIDQERSQESIIENIFGTIAGAGMATIGIIAFSSIKDPDDFGDAIGNFVYTLIGIPFVVGGSTLFIYNSYATIRDSRHKLRRISNERAYELYKNKRAGRVEQESSQSAQILITPAFNIMTASAGFNLHVFF